MIGRWLRQRFVRDTAALQAATAVQGCTYLVTSVLTAKVLGPSELGRWVTTREVYNFAFLLVTAGLVPATVRIYAEALGRGDRLRATDALAAMLKVGGTAAVLLALVAAFLGPWIGENLYHDRRVGVFAAVLALSGLFEVVRSGVMAALQGGRLMLLFTALDVSSNVVRVLLVALVLALDRGIAGLVTVFVFHLAFAAALALWMYRRARRLGGDARPPGIRRVLGRVARAPARMIFGLSYLIALNKAMNALVPRLGMLLIPAQVVRRQAAMVENGHYSVAHVLAWAVALALTGVAQAFLPALGHKMGREGLSFGATGPLFRRVSLTAGGLMAAATLLSVPVMYLVIRYVYGVEYLDSFRLYLLLSLGNLVLGFSVVIDAFFIYSGLMAKVVPWNLLAAALAAAGITYGAAFHGPAGVALAAGLSRWLSFAHLGFIVWYFRRERRQAGGALASGVASADKMDGSEAPPPRAG